MLGLSMSSMTLLALSRRFLIMSAIKVQILCIEFCISDSFMNCNFGSIFSSKGKREKFFSLNVLFLLLLYFFF